MIHKQKVQVFIVTPDYPKSTPRRSESFEILSHHLDGLLHEAKQQLRKAGFVKERSISFTPEGLVAYVEQAA